MSEILNAIQHQGLAFAILAGVLFALYRGDIITKSHFDDYRAQRDRYDDELRRELQEKDKELDEWPRIAGPQPFEKIADIIRAALSSELKDRGSIP